MFIAQNNNEKKNAPHVKWWPAATHVIQVSPPEPLKIVARLNSHGDESPCYKHLSPPGPQIPRHPSVGPAATHVYSTTQKREVNRSACQLGASGHTYLTIYSPEPKKEIGRLNSHGDKPPCYKHLSPLGPQNLRLPTFDTATDPQIEKDTARQTQPEISSEKRCTHRGRFVFYDVPADDEYSESHRRSVKWNMKMPQIPTATKIDLETSPDHS